jgi:hypothetical protein
MRAAALPSALMGDETSAGLGPDASTTICEPAPEPEAALHRPSLWRTARDELGVPDVRTHTFRKTVATLIDDEGLSARIGADHLGHAKISMTQDVYMARGRMHTQVAELLDRTVQQTAPPGCLDSARNCRPNSVAAHGVTVQNMREQGESGG